jgi:hypothetical protein
MTTQATLLTHVHMVPVRDDVVVLDTRADRYACLVGAAGLLAFSDAGAVSAAPEVIDDLKAAGLVGPVPSTPSHRTPIAARTLITTAQFRNRPLEQLIARSRGSTLKAKPSDQRRISLRASAYRKVLPFLPREGACLQRAWQLRQVLASDGLAVDWVFGVRTWPFFAHCWLQHEDLVVADRFEHVRAFTPIAVF